MKVTQTYYTKDIDGEYFVAQPQPTLREMEPGDVDDTMSVAERAVRIVLAKAKGVCLSKVHAIDHAGNSYLREASATQCANAIGALNIQPLIDQVKGILSLPTQPEPPADVARDAEPVAYVTGYYAGYLSIATIDGRVLPAGTALFTAPPAPSVPYGWRPFLTDVITAAGLLEHGKRDNGLAGRIGKFAFDAMRAAQTPAEPPADVARDAERLDWLLRKLPGGVLRYCVGVLSDTSDGKEFREAIDAAIEREIFGGEQA